MLRPIGQGAYGQVWLALNVVGTLRAVKVLYRHVFGDEHPFAREFKGIQKFEPISRSHPGVVNILQIGRNDAEGYFYYVMELADDSNADGRVQSAESPDELAAIGVPHSKDAADRRAEESLALPGTTDQRRLEDSPHYQPRTLRSDLKRRGRLPFDECVQLALSLTSALEHLHQHDLVHRDVKPSNIIFVNGQPKLADIGLVASVDEARSFVGTEGFVPPEGPGKPQADLYSLGIVLYVMSTGKRHDAFPEPRLDLGSDPDRGRWVELNAVIHKACYTDPRERYQSAGEMHADLLRLHAGKSVRRQQRWARAMRLGKRAAPIAAVAVVLGLGVTWAMRRQAPGPSVPAEKASVFVLPFRTEGSNGFPGDLCGRITDAFIDSLALIEGVQRSPRKSGWAYLDENALRHALARTNSMRHVLTGRISSTNDRVGLRLALYKHGTEQPLWTESFSGETNGLIAVELRALSELTARLGLKASASDGQRISTLLTNNLAAFRWYQQAQAVYALKAGTQNGYKEVRELAQKATELDPHYVDADYYDAYMLRNLFVDRAPSDVWLDVQRRMQRILEQDDTHVGAWDQMSGYFLHYRRDWDTAYVAFNRALCYCPEQRRHFLQAFFYRIYGWFDEARIYQERCEHPEPTDIDIRFFMASSRWVERRYAEGVQVARRTLELYPGQAEGYQSLAHCLVANGEYEAGIEATHKAQEVWKQQEMTALRAVAYAKWGQPEKAREVLKELLEVERIGPYLQPYFVARVYSALSEKEKALDWLEKAEQDKTDYLIVPDFCGGLRTDPAWDDYRDEPRVQALLKKVGLDQWPRPKPHIAPGQSF